MFTGVQISNQTYYRQFPRYLFEQFIAEDLCFISGVWRRLFIDEISKNYIKGDLK